MRVLCMVPFILLSAPAFAQEAMAKVYACADIEDAGQRHACFDALVPELRKGRAAAVAAPATPSVKPQQQAEAFGSPRAATSPLIAPVKTPAESKATAVAEKEQSIDKVSLPVKSISTAGDGKYRFVMENGQIWKQIDTEKLRNIGSGPWTAEIKKASMGSFLLSLGGSRTVRVERMN
jgi:hypothetical protein